MRDILTAVGIASMSVILGFGVVWLALNGIPAIEIILVLIVILLLRKGVNRK